VIRMPKIPAAAVLLAAAALIGPLSGTSSAATFNVSPTQVFLSGAETSTLLTIRNESAEPLRFQLSVFAWTQNAAGEMVLTPTNDVVFFPALLTLGPNEERKVRIGRVVAAGEVERTYRIFVEELPPLDAVVNAGASVRLLTRMGVPVFVRPSKDVTAPSVEGVTADLEAVRFTVANTGTIHFVPDRVVVRGLAHGAPVFERSVQAWYVLAGGRREFQLALADLACAGATSIQVEATIAGTTIDKRVDLPAGACRP